MFRKSMKRFFFFFSPACRKLKPARFVVRILLLGGGGGGCKRERERRGGGEREREREREAAISESLKRNVKSICSKGATELQKWMTACNIHVCRQYKMYTMPVRSG